jgi:catechol 2,3-dioxygenase-like lactoylglutathione lyase family enzyme
MTDWTSSVADVRLARPTAQLDRQEAFYDGQRGLSRIASFRDHEGYDGTIWRLGPGGPQFELCAGPEPLETPQAPETPQPSAAPERPGAGWGLDMPGGRSLALADADGYEWRVTPGAAAATGIRPTGRVRECRAFYERALGLPASADDGNLTVALPAGRGFIRLEPASDVPAPTVEDMLVFYFAERDARDRFADTLLAAGAPPVRPHNPWWQLRARCLADPDGIVLALAFDP